MIKLEHTRVYNIVDAMRGMRNPKNSWARNDTKCIHDVNSGTILKCEIGPNDRTLAQTLIKAGTEHRKFLRQIFVSVDVICPIYFVQEFDTYKVSTTRNSCSVQHKGTSKEFDLSDFTLDKFDMSDPHLEKLAKSLPTTIETMNSLRDAFNETKDMKYFRLLRQYMPMGYNYRFTWTANYEVLLGIYRQRRFHKLIEWHSFCDWIKSLPGMDVFIIEDNAV